MNERCKDCVDNFCVVRNIHLNRIHFEQCHAGESLSRIDKLYETIAANRSAKNGEVKIVLATAEQPPQANHWVPLHYYAVEHAHDWDESAARVFYKQWEKTIPNTGGCSCRAKWKKLGLVPDYFSAKAFFEWAWLAHDTVTQRLITEGKPLTRLTLAEAYSTWGFSVADPVHQTA